MHLVRHAEGIRHLVDETKPRADVRDVTWGREVTDCLKVPAARAKARRSDSESGELHLLTREHELLRVQYDTVPATDVKPLDSLVKALLDGVGPQENVINTLRLPRDL